MQSPEDLSRIEAELKERLTSAKEAYEAVRFDSARLQQIKADVGLNHPDGVAAIQKALRLELSAFQHYSEALIAFSDFLLEKVPRDLAKRAARHIPCEKRFQLEEALVCIIQSKHPADAEERGALLAAERKAVTALQDHIREHGCGGESRGEDSLSTGRR
jgi:hypothetical protein